MQPVFIGGSGKGGDFMRSYRWVTLAGLLLGTGAAYCQPPKASVPRNLPESPASALPESKPVTMAEKPTAQPALIKVKVPDAATIWFENQKMSQSGATRVFQSPGLEAKKTYFYKVKVSWPTGAGTLAKDFVSEQEVAVKAGETTTIDFTPLVTHTKEVKPTSTRDMIRQAAYATPAPDRSKSTTKTNKE